MNLHCKVIMLRPRNRKRGTTLCARFTYVVRTRTLLQPIDKGNNKYGRQGTEKCSNCRKHHQKVFLFCPRVNSRVFMTMHTRNALTVCERIWLAATRFRAHG